VTSQGAAEGDEGGLAGVLGRAVAAAGGQRRDGQVAMAEAVMHALASRRHLLVQAGTGTGKSWAYLVPALLAAGRGKGRVVVATSTLALQAQLVSHDLPRLADAATAALGRRPTWALLKGRHNYLCRHRIATPGDDAGAGDALWQEAPPGVRSGLETQVIRLRTWAEETATGDRDDLDPGVSDRAWRAVSVTARECLGATRCPQGAECFSEAARRAAREADIVVTNHALLAIDAADRPGTLPEHAAVIIDEGHDFVDRVTGALTAEISAATVAAAAATARVAGGDIADLESAGRALSGALDAAPVGRLASGVPRSMADALLLVATAARSAARSVAPATPGESTTRVQAARATLSELEEVAIRLTGHEVAPTAADAAGAIDGSMTGAADTARTAAVNDEPASTAADQSRPGADVLWVEESESRGRSLHGAPLSVARMLAERVLSDRTVIMTSATLAPGGRFDVLARRVGLPVGGEDERPWDSLDAGSPFDYGRQGILYIAAHLPPPGRDEHPQVLHAEIEALVTAAGGATLGLFSSRRAAVAATEILRKRTSIPVLCQGDDTAAALVRRFAKDDATCLFGTLGLWQGVDVPGAACRLVLIDRIPFPRPDDPLTSARSEAVDAAGGSGFAAISVNHAATLLAQGAGRLIRRVDDRGVVAVLDSRLLSRRYGAVLIRAMPPMWRTTDTGVVTEALRRLSAGAVAG